MATWTYYLLVWLVWTRETIEMKYVSSRGSQSLLRIPSLSTQDSDAVSGAVVVLFDQLLTCGWDHAVIIRDHWAEELAIRVSAALLDRLSTIRHVTLHLNTPKGNYQWLEERMEQLYILHRMTNVVVMTSNAGGVLRAATNVFLKHHRGLGALMVHRMQFAFFAGNADAEHFRKDLELTPFDNVFVVASPDVTRMWTDAYTLMWRKGRTRELEKIDARLIRAPSRKSCAVFPNLKFKMNGRKLKLLIKEWLSLAYKKRDIEKGRVEYEGFFVNVVHLLSESLNFTYDFQSSEEEDENLQWKDFAYLVSQSKFDMGVGVYPISSIEHFNHTVTFPLICTNFTGYYVYTKPDFTQSQLILYEVDIYICFISSLVYTLILLKIIYRAVPKRNSARAIDDELIGTLQEHEHDVNARSLRNEGRVDFQCQVSDADVISYIETINCDVAFDEVNRKISESCTSGSNLSQSITSEVQSYLASDEFKDEKTNNDKENGLQLQSIERKKKFPTKSYLHKFDSIVSLFFEFVGCSLNQCGAPNPAYFSARLLVWSWCFMVLVFNALFTGNITANIVGSTSDVPLTTIEDLLARDDYTICIEKESSFQNTMKNFPEGSAVFNLYKRSERFQVENPHFNGTLAEMVSKLESQKMVALLSSPMQEYIREKYIPNLISLRNSIFETCSGFILPQNSEMDLWISEKLRMMTDAGLIDNLKRISRNATKVQYTEFDEVGTLHLNFIVSLFFKCIYGLSISAIVLVIEYACTRLQLIDI